MRVSSRFTGPLFVFPALFVLALLVFYPLVYTVVLSVTDPAGNYVGLENFRTMLDQRLTGITLRNTFVYVFFSIVFQIILGTAVGLLLNAPFWGRSALRAMIVVPWVIPGIVAATTWAWMFHTEFGIINYMAQGAGVIDQPIGWLTNPNTVMPALVTVNVWKMFPFVAIMVLAGLQAIPKDVYEAARIDGAKLHHEIIFVTLPYLKPVLSSLSLLLAIWGLNAITIIYAMTGGGPANRSIILPIQIFRQAFQFFQFNQAAALSVMFLGITGVLMVLYVTVFAEKE
ncbi:MULTISPECIES: carbohydrate ABC transporter permease [Martelella]|uniref:ABC transporter permease n=2 Tax=Martelella TaxID=293088 RepID=A0A0D5LLK7_MAREN|nr:MULTISPECIES: sugar ABC transporter permease [Martelella]AJY45031.1 ABC transporter permease [Martelella endophytica]MBB4123759.1 multiple sugar transport system permease protein [Martelella radicis]